MIGLQRDARHFYEATYEGLQQGKQPGITTVIGVLNKPALPSWAAGIAGAKAFEFRALIEPHLGHPTQDVTCAICMSGKPWDKTPEDRLTSWYKGLPWATRDAAADIGTRVHAIAEAMQKGEKPVVADDVVPFAEAYIRDFLEPYKPQSSALYVEAMVYHSGQDGTVLPYGGTMDLFCRIGDEVWLLDFKTSKSGVYGETALQLAAGRFAEFIGRPGDPKRYPVPKVTRCGVVWVRPEKAELIEYSVTPREFQAFTACRLAWDWVTNRSKEVKGAA